MTRFDDHAFDNQIGKEVTMTFNPTPDRTESWQATVKDVQVRGQGSEVEMTLEGQFPEELLAVIGYEVKVKP
jgi:hypothetical protein